MNSQIPLILPPVFKMCLLLSVLTLGHVVIIFSFPDYSSNFLNYISEVNSPPCPTTSRTNLYSVARRSVINKNLIISLSVFCLKFSKILSKFRIKPKLNAACDILVWFCPSSSLPLFFLSSHHVLFCLRMFAHAVIFCWNTLINTYSQQSPWGQER